MSNNKIGVLADSFRLDLKEGIKKSREVGASAVQLYAVSGPMHPDNLDKQERKELLDFIKSNGLEVSALCGDPGGHGFTKPEKNEARIELSKKIMELALDLETDVVTTHIGVIPDEQSSPRYRVMQQACEELGEFADQIGASFAVETGPETAQKLKNFLDSLNSTGVKVNYDPANLVMVVGDDPLKGVYTLQDYITHIHVKDGVQLKQTDPQKIYDYFAEGGIEDMRLEEYFLETPLGEGDVDVPGFLAALEDIGYDGYLTIEREVGDNPEQDIIKAVQYLENLQKC
ncbi:MAG: sugar phosphate isomerase/epimerase family protein [Halanaerobiaceae bacterium]